MKFSWLLLLPLGWVSCASVPPGAATPGAKTCYHYVNQLDFGNNNSLDHITVTGYDEDALGEATRLEVAVGSAHIILRDKTRDASRGSGVMYNPRVELDGSGALVVTWTLIGESTCRVKLVAGSNGRIVESMRQTW